MQDNAVISGKLKFISEELARSPFNYDLNSVAFASLEPESLLNVLHEVLCDVDPRFGERDRDPEIYTRKVLTLLQVLRYCSQEYDLETLWHALEEIIPEVLWDIIHWVLSNKVQLKQRAYLAQYLVKIPVPNEIRNDDDVDECYTKYEETISQFKKTHKNLQDLRIQCEKKSLAELVTDSEKLDHEIECVSKKLDSIKTRICLNTETEQLFAKIREIRKAKEVRQKTMNQMNFEEHKLTQMSRRAELQRYRFNTMAQSNLHATPEASIERLKQDAEVLQIVVSERLPYQIYEVNRSLMAMSKVEENPPIGRMDLEPTALKLTEIKREIKHLLSEKSSKDLDPALNFARNKVAEGKRRKLELADDVEESKNDLLALQMVLEDRKAERERYNEGMPSQEGYKEYIKEMRNKTASYKDMRIELQALQNDVSLLNSTKIIIEENLRESENELRKVEEQLGIVGFTTTENELESLSTEKSKVDEIKMNSIYEMGLLAKELNDKIADRTQFFQHIMGEVSCKRTEFEQMTGTLMTLKTQALIEMTPVYEAQLLLEKQIEETSKTYLKNQVEYAKIQAEIPLLKSHIFRAHDVERCMGVKVRSYREVLLAKIAENERYNSGLKIETEELPDEEEYSENQKFLWSNLTLILEKKMSVIKASSESAMQDQDLSESAIPDQDPFESTMNDSSELAIMELMREEDEEDHYYEDDALLCNMLANNSDLIDFD